MVQTLELSETVRNDINIFFRKAYILLALPTGASLDWFVGWLVGWLVGWSVFKKRIVVAKRWQMAQGAMQKAFIVGLGSVETFR